MISVGSIPNLADQWACLHHFTFIISWFQSGRAPTLSKFGGQFPLGPSGLKLSSLMMLWVCLYKTVCQTADVTCRLREVQYYWSQWRLPDGSHWPFLEYYGALVQGVCFRQGGQGGQCIFWSKCRISWNIALNMNRTILQSFFNGHGFQNAKTFTYSYTKHWLEDAFFNFKLLLNGCLCSDSI